MPGRTWSKYEDEIIRAFYAHKGTVEIVKILHNSGYLDRDTRCVQKRASVLGVKRVGRINKNFANIIHRGGSNYYA